MPRLAETLRAEGRRTTEHTSLAHADLTGAPVTRIRRPDMRVMDQESATGAVNLSLYQFEGCPYCELVRDASQRLGIALEWRDIEADAQHRRDLVLARGRATVPVLRITRQGEPDIWMPESLDIVRYLEAHVGVAAPGSPSLASRSVWWAGASAWVLLVAGGLAPEPARSLLWTLACAVAAARSLAMAVRTGHARHWMIGGALGLGAVANALSGLGVAHVPWWHLAAPVALVVLASAGLRRNAAARQRRRA